MKTETQTVAVVILEQNACHLGASLDEDAAMALVAVTSEDPSCWDDMVAYWPRYQIGEVPEFVDALAIKPVEVATARGALEEHNSWIVIDLVQKRIVTGRDVEPIGRDQAFAMAVDDSGEQHCPLSVHLPPWWEMHEQTDASVIDRPRESPARVPSVKREILFGEPLIEDLATRMLDAVETDQWRSRGASEDARARYQFTIAVHRDWLMTPRQDLGGLMPRQMLHGAREWIDQLVWAQQMRFQHGSEIVAAPTNVSGYDDAPMGGEEIVIYFELCRELIGAGWQWCIENGLDSGQSADRPERQRELVACLTDVKQQWLNSPFEDDSPPRFVIECSRRRVPRGAGVPIVGMNERQTEEHATDCDCPICNMMADGMFGPGFMYLDGHQLELDNEFAFSMHQTRQAWEEEQLEFAEMSATMDREPTEGESADEAEPDEFASAWSGQMSDEPLPGDPQDHMKLAFLLAEVVGILQSVGAPHDDIQQLNDRFTEFRQSNRTDLPARGKRLGEHLEELAGRYPELVSRVADLQSRIDEQVRSPAFDDDNPF